jgi:WD40 repeat protein
VNSSGTRIVTFSENGLLRLLDLQTEKVLQITKINSKLFPNDIAFSQDSRHIAIGFANQSIKILTTESFKETHSYQHSAPVRHLEWHPDNELLQVVSSDDSRKIVVFDYIANKIVGQVEGGHTFSFADGGKSIVTIHDQEIRVYDYRTLKLKQKCVVG